MLILYETCLEYFRRRLSEGCKELNKLGSYQSRIPQRNMQHKKGVGGLATQIIA